jgi:hypothetical protein
MAITLEQAKERLDLWLDAEAAVATGQSYSIAGRSLSRADLSDIHKMIGWWEARIRKLERGETGIRSRRVLVRDL